MHPCDSRRGHNYTSNPPAEALCIATALRSKQLTWGMPLNMSENWQLSPLVGCSPCIRLHVSSECDLHARISLQQPPLLLSPLRASCWHMSAASAPPQLPFFQAAHTLQYRRASEFAQKRLGDYHIGFAAVRKPYVILSVNTR